MKENEYLNLFKYIYCLACHNEYKITWNTDKFDEPACCARCGCQDIEVVNNGFMS